MHKFIQRQKDGANPANKSCQVELNFHGSRNQIWWKQQKNEKNYQDEFQMMDTMIRSQGGTLEDYLLVAFQYSIYVLSTCGREGLSPA